MINRTIKIPDSSFSALNALKIKVANSTGSIPTNGSIIKFALFLADKHYEELLSELTKENE